MNILSSLKSWLAQAFTAPAVPKLPAVDMAAVGPRALELILSFEGIDQPDKRPPGDSGITLGHGFDLGYNTAAQFREAWGRHLPERDINLLLTAIGKKGEAAEAIKARFKGCSRISTTMAREVFDRCTLPRFRALTAKAFPGCQRLTPDQQGVLVSIVFNRGESLNGPRRREMANIAKLLRDANLDYSPATAQTLPMAISRQILSMQRLWPSENSNTGHPGLRRRRRAEAALMAES